MIENTENQATPVEPVPTYEDLLIKVNELNSQLSNARDARDYNGKQLDKVRAYIQNSIDNDNWTDEELSEIFWDELADILDLEIKKSVEVYISVQWSATVKMPRSMDLDDIAGELRIGEPEANWSSIISIESIYEDETTITEA